MTTTVGPTPTRTVLPVELEIYEYPAVAGDGEDRRWIPIRPNHVRINGVDCLTPEDAVKIHPPLDGNCLKATITLFVRSLTIHDGAIYEDADND